MDNHTSLYQLNKKKKLLSNINKYEYFHIPNHLTQSYKNNHTKYHKLYNISKSSEDSTKREIEQEKLKMKLKDQKKYEILQKLFKKQKVKPPKTFVQITKPKLPFSSKKEVNPELKRMRINSLRPSTKFHDVHTIKWLRQKYSNSVLEKSINTLLPDNGKPVIPDDESEKEKNHRKLMEFLESTKPVIDREKNVNINPKYFFDKKTFEKILKLKEIFLEFDEDGSRKMEIDEMLTMFNQNNIRADINELVKLFFKDQKTKNLMSLYLDFYQFMEFALNQEQDFRNFMREIKRKYKKDKNKYQKKENTYLPMSFNLVLDYFITKGKERSALEIIKKSMEDMDNVLNKGLQKDKNLLNLNLSIFRSQTKKKSIDIKDIRRLSTIRSFKTRLTLSNIKNINLNTDNESSSDENERAKNMEQLEKINFKEPMKEFDNLFKAHGLNFLKKTNNNKLNLTSNSYEKKLTKIYHSNQNSLLSDNSTTNRKTPTTRIVPNKKKIIYINNEDSTTGNLSNNVESKNIESSENNSVITDMVNNYMNKRLIQRMNLNNYDKFHNVKIALDKSNKEIDIIKILNKKKDLKDIDNNIKIKENNFSKDNIDYFNNSFFKNKKIENINKKNKYGLNNLYEKKYNPFFMNSSYFGNKNKTYANKFLSFDKSNNMINDYFRKNVDSQKILTYRKGKLNKHRFMEETICKINNYEYVPTDLLNEH